MKPENKGFLEANEHTWITLRDAGYMLGLDGNTRSRMVQVISEEFQPGYATDLWCPPCVSDMVTLLYRYFNTWREHNKLSAIPDALHVKKSEMIESLLTVTAGDTQSTAVQDFGPPPRPPKVVKANFPKHNNHRR